MGYTEARDDQSLIQGQPAMHTGKSHIMDAYRGKETSRMYTERSDALKVGRIQEEK